MADKAPEAFRTISEVSDLLETPPHVLRFWESKFSQLKPVKRAGGRRYYRPADVALLAGLKRLLHDDGMTIRGVQKLLREQGVRHVADLGRLAEPPATPDHPTVAGSAPQIDATAAAPSAASAPVEPVPPAPPPPSAPGADPAEATGAQAAAPDTAATETAAPEVAGPERGAAPDAPPEATPEDPTPDATAPERAVPQAPGALAGPPEGALQGSQDEPAPVVPQAVSPEAGPPSLTPEGATAPASPTSAAADAAPEGAGAEEPSEGAPAEGGRAANAEAAERAVADLFAGLDAADAESLLPEGGDDLDTEPDGEFASLWADIDSAEDEDGADDVRLATMLRGLSDPFAPDRAAAARRLGGRLAALHARMSERAAGGRL